MFRKFGKLAFFAVLFVVFVGCGSKDAPVNKTKEKAATEKEIHGAPAENPTNKEIEKIRNEFEVKLKILSEENKSLRQKISVFEKQQKKLTQEIEKVRQEKNSVNEEKAEADSKEVPVVIEYKDSNIIFKIINNKTGEEKVFKYPYYGPAVPAYTESYIHIIELLPGTYKFISYSSKDGKVLESGRFTVTEKPSIKGWLHGKIILRDNSK